MPGVFVEPAIVRPTGSMWDRPPGAVAWIGSTKLTAKPSKTATYIRWTVTPSGGYAEGLHGKQAPKAFIPMRVQRSRKPLFFTQGRVVLAFKTIRLKQL